MACPSPACPSPARLPACDSARAAPFGHFLRLPFVASRDVNLVDCNFARQLNRWHFGDQAAAQLLRNGLHVRSIQAQLKGDLPVGKVQAHEVEAQHPHPQRLVVPGQHRSGQVVEAPSACFAPVATPEELCVVVAVADYCIVVAGRAPNAVRPAVLAHEGEAFRIVHQTRKVD